MYGVKSISIVFVTLYYCLYQLAICRYLRATAVLDSFLKSQVPLTRYNHFKCASIESRKFMFSYDQLNITHSTVKFIYFRRKYDKKFIS